MSKRTYKTISIDAETARRISKIGEKTHRTDGRVVDWAVDKIWFQEGFQIGEGEPAIGEVAEKEKE